MSNPTHFTGIDQHTAPDQVVHSVLKDGRLVHVLGHKDMSETELLAVIEALEGVTAATKRFLGK